MNAIDKYRDAISKCKTYCYCTKCAKEELMTQQSQRPALPLSLRKKRVRNILKRVIPCVLLFAFILAAIILRGEEIFDFPHRLAQRVVYAIFLLLPFVITGVPLKLIDQSFSGTVIAVNVTEKIGVYSRSFAKGGIYTRHDLVLTIQTDEGKKIKYTALSLGVKNRNGQFPPGLGSIEHRTEDYSVGDRVHKYYGFRALWVTPQNSDDQKYCIVCGTKNGNDDSRCWSCHSELVS